MALPDKALSIRQPWAWAILFAGKDVENRSWQAINHGLNMRGRIAIHAAAGLARIEYHLAALTLEDIGVSCPPAIDLPRGGIVGSVEVVDVVKSSDSPWFVGPRGLVLRNPAPCEFIPVKGSLGFFDWRERLTDHMPTPQEWMRRADRQPPAQGSLI